MEKQRALGFLQGVHCFYWARVRRGWWHVYIVRDGRILPVWGYVAAVLGVIPDYDAGAVPVLDVRDAGERLALALGVTVRSVEL